MSKAKELAKEIAWELFTNVVGEIADRLVLEVNGKDRGGYCREAVERTIAAKLEPLVSDAERYDKLRAWAMSDDQESEATND